MFKEVRLSKEQDQYLIQDGSSSLDLHPPIDKGHLSASKLHGDVSEGLYHKLAILFYPTRDEGFLYWVGRRLY